MRTRRGAKGLLGDLADDAAVAGDMDTGGRPPLRGGEDKERHSGFREGHVAVVAVPVEEVQWGANVLRYCEAGQKESQYKGESWGF